MSTPTKVIIGLVIVAAIIAGGIFATQSKSGSYSSNQSSSASPAPSTGSTPAASAATITYSSKGFAPSVTTVKAGDTVTVKNTDSEDMQFNSDPHPNHTAEPELNVGLIKPGTSKTFTITKQGTWGFHNHFNPSEHGQIVVQ